jgi:hypothetical protein
MADLVKLLGVRAKVERAKKHILEFESAKTAFLNAESHRVRPYKNPKTGEWQSRVESVSTIPPELPAIAGDAIHNLRSALDHLAHQLILANGRSPTIHSGFPILNTANNKAEFRRKVKGMSRAAVKAIRLFKPYKRGNRSLWTLHRLDIADKHHLLLAVAATYENVVLKKSVGQGIEVTLTLEPKHLKPLKVGDVLLRHFDKDDLNTEFSFDVALNEPGVVKCQPALPLLRELSDAVENVVSNFTLFFQ